MNARRPRAAPEAMIAMASDLRVVRTPVLDVAFEDRGPRAGYPVLLAHGWADSVRTWDAVLPLLHASGYRTIAYHLRGFGPTRFRRPDELPSGEDVALADDLLALARALELDRFAVVGHDWGARAGYLAAALEPRRICHLVALAQGYQAGPLDTSLPLHRLREHWYEWMFALPTAEHFLLHRRRELAGFLWRTWSPDWSFTESALYEASLAFENPAFTGVTLHAHRQRRGLVAGDPRYRELRRAAEAVPQIQVATMVLHGATDAGSDPITSDGRDHLFAGPYRRLLLPGVGHFPQREVPDRVAAEIVAWLAAPPSEHVPSIH